MDRSPAWWCPEHNLCWPQGLKVEGEMRLLAVGQVWEGSGTTLGDRKEQLKWHLWVPLWVTRRLMENMGGWWREEMELPWLWVRWEGWQCRWPYKCHHEWLTELTHGNLSGWPCTWVMASATRDGRRGSSWERGLGTGGGASEGVRGWRAGGRRDSGLLGATGQAPGLVSWGHCPCRKEKNECVFSACWKWFWAKGLCLLAGVSLTPLCQKMIDLTVSIHSIGKNNYYSNLVHFDSAW